MRNIDLAWSKKKNLEHITIWSLDVTIEIMGDMLF